MRKLAAMFLAFCGLWIASCQRDGSGVTPESSAFESVAATAARYSVMTDSVTVGKCRGKLTEVAVADLSAVIAGYISTTYPGSTIKVAAKDDDGKVVVALVLADGSAKGLLFNADGTFKQEMKQHEHKGKIAKIEVSALPAPITSYITASYTSAVIKAAGKNADGEYFVAITVDGKIKVLLFKADGTFSKELEKPAFPPAKPGRPGKGGKQ
jgi:hypothetical protein